MIAKLERILFLLFSFYLLSCYSIPTHKQGTLVTDYFSPLTHLPLTKKPVTRFYNLNLRQKNLSPDGFERRVWAANDVYPGPIIRANKGDKIFVNVTNCFGE